MTAQTLRYSTQQLPLAEDDLRGRPLSVDLKLVRLIGRGGMGEVWEAESDDLRGQRFAVKIISETVSKDPGVIARFFGEARAASAIDDPNIIGVHGTGRTRDKRPALVMPFIDGKSLGDMCDEGGPLPLDIVGKVLLQLASALRAAHGVNIIHRDIKPQNVMVMPRRWGRDWFVLLVDFGICKFQDAELAAEIRTGTKQYIGTPGYSAPEQVLAKAVTAKADIYSLGVLAYRVLTGRDPYDGDSVMEIMHKQISGTEVKEPIALRADIPREWNDLILLCLDPHPAHRPTASEFGRWIAAGMPDGATMLTTLAPQIAADTRAVANAATISSDVPTALAQLQALARRREKKRQPIVALIAAAIFGGALATAAIKFFDLSTRSSSQLATSVPDPLVDAPRPARSSADSAGVAPASGVAVAAPASGGSASVAVAAPASGGGSAGGAVAAPASGGGSAGGAVAAPASGGGSASSPAATIPSSSGKSTSSTPPASRAVAEAGNRATKASGTPPPPNKRAPAPNNDDSSSGRAGGRAATGQLIIRSKSWADCFLADGDREVSIGTSPTTATLPSGKHQIRCENKGLHKDETVTVVIDPAKPAELEKNW